MFTTIQKWGNSQGLRIPKPMLESVGIRENDRVELIQTADSITIKKAVALPHKTLEQRLVEFYEKPIKILNAARRKKWIGGRRRAVRYGNGV